MGGAHRFNAAVILGFQKIPAFVLEDEKFQDVDMQKFLTMRLNMLHGKMTPNKFKALYEDLMKRYDDESIRQEMALVDKGEFEELKKCL